MKKVFLVLASIVALFLAVIIIIPIIFKDDIAKTIESEIDKSIDAKVHFSSDKLSLSLLSSFPSLTAEVADFAISGKGTFEGDTLFYAKQFVFSLDVMSVISGDHIAIEEVSVYEPLVNVMVTEDGQANYDIAKASDTEEEAPVEESSGSSPAIKIHHWSIADGEFRYVDKTMPVQVYLHGLNHKGSGDFASNVFDMLTETEIKSGDIYYEGIHYISKARATAEVNMNMDLDNMKFTFKENFLKVNDFTVGAEGWLAMPSDDIEMSLDFGAKDNTFKSLLSLVPGMYQKDFEGLESSGSLDFHAVLKGIYNDTSMPDFNMNLNVKNGMFHYPDLPSSVEKVFVDVLIDVPNASPEQSLVEVKKFSLEMADNPIAGNLKVEGAEKYNLALDGTLDLGTVQKIYPLDSTTLDGLITTHIKVSGRVSDTENKDLKASGAMDIDHFKFVSNDLPQGMSISEAHIKLSPMDVILEKYEGTLGKTDLALKGRLSNYMEYALNDQTLKGVLTLDSKVLDANEWMTEEEEATVETTDSTAMAVVEVPKNLDMTFDAHIGKVLFSDFPMDNMQGKLTVKGGVVRMNKLKFDTMGGEISTTGAYDASDINDPKFDFDLKVTEVEFGEAYKHVTMIQKYAPIAKNITGDFSAGLGIAGNLLQDMSPDLNTMFGQGLVKVKSASLQGVEVLNKVSDLAKIKELKDPSIKDIAAKFTIENGTLEVEPFTFSMAGIKTTVGGSNKLTGEIDYDLTLDPTNTAYAKYTGGYKLMFDISGTYDSPTIKPVLDEVLKEQLDKSKKQATEDAKDLMNDLLEDSKDGDIDKDKTIEKAKEKGKKLLDSFFK